MTKRMRIGVVGLGMAVTPHAKGLIDLADRLEVVGAFSPTAERRAAFAARFPFPVVDDIDALVRDPTVEGVMILTPPNTHLDLVRTFAAAGKHILLEKPLEVSPERARALVEACEMAGVTLAVCLQHRFRPAGERLREILAAGEIGDIVGCSTVIRLWRPQSYYDQPGRGVLARDGGGVLLTQGIHTLDLMLSLAGPVAEVTGFATTTPVHRMETEDMVAGALRFANGAIGTVDATTAAYPGFLERIEITARHGTATLTGSTLEVRHHDGRTETLAAEVGAGGTGADPMAFPHDFHRAVAADFVAAVRGGRPPRVDGREALKVHGLIEALVEAGRTGRPVRL